MKTAHDTSKLSFPHTRECRVLFREGPLEWRAEEKDPGSSITGQASRIVQSVDRIVSLSSGDRVLSLPFVRGGQVG